MGRECQHYNKGFLDLKVPSSDRRFAWAPSHDIIVNNLISVTFGQSLRGSKPQLCPDPCTQYRQQQVPRSLPAPARVKQWEGAGGAHFLFSRTSFVRLILQMTTTAARARLPKKEKKRGEMNERPMSQPKTDGVRAHLRRPGRRVGSV